MFAANAPAPGTLVYNKKKYEKVKIYRKTKNCEKLRKNKTAVFGLFLLINGSKFYGLILVCRVTRAVKIAVLDSLSMNSLFETLEFLWVAVERPARI